MGLSGRSHRRAQDAPAQKSQQAETYLIPTLRGAFGVDGAAKKADSPKMILLPG
jgi:hypothetical protein